MGRTESCHRQRWPALLFIAMEITKSLQFIRSKGIERSHMLLERPSPRSRALDPNQVFLAGPWPF